LLIRHSKYSAMLSKIDFAHCGKRLSYYLSPEHDVKTILSDFLGFFIGRTERKLDL